MTLRRKLFVLFGSLVAMTFLAAGITTWAVINWQDTENELQRHYERSLKLQNVRALTFQAVLEVPEGLTGNDPDARQDFEETIAPAEDALTTWSELVDTPEERKEVEEVQSAFDTLVADSHRAFDRIEAGDFAAAEQIFDEQIEEASSESFQAISARAEDADADRREIIHDATAQTRNTAEVMLIIAAIGAFCIALLLGAYLISDVFTPLKDVRRALVQARKGDRSVRLNEDRKDEFGEVNRVFNQLLATLGTAEGKSAESAVGETAGETSRADDSSAAESHTVTLERAPVRPLVYEVVSRVYSELAEQAADLEVVFDTSVSHVHVDYLKVQQALSALIVNALSHTEEAGGQVGLRITDNADDGDPRLIIEVGGTHPESSRSRPSPGHADTDAADDDAELPFKPRRRNLALVRAVAEQHGGELVLEDLGARGSYSRIELGLAR